MQYISSLYPIKNSKTQLCFDMDTQMNSGKRRTVCFYEDYCSICKKFNETNDGGCSHNIFTCLFSVHNRISSSHHKQVCLTRLHFETYFSHHRGVQMIVIHIYRKYANLDRSNRASGLGWMKLQNPTN